MNQMMQRLSRAGAALLLFSVACKSTEPVVTPAAISTTAAPAGIVALGASAGAFAVKVTDGSSNPLVGVTVNFAAAGSGMVSPTTIATDANGLAQTTVTASGVAGALTVSATVAGTSLRTEASVTVQQAAGPADCIAPAVGDVSQPYQNVLSLCLTAAAGGADYTIVAFNSDTLATRTTSMVATGVTTPPAANVLAPSPTLAYRGVSTLGQDLVPDLAFHQRMRNQARRLASLVPAAREWQAAGGSARTASPSSSSSILSPSGALRSAIPSNPAVGDLLSINADVNGDCTTKDYRTARVVAIGTRSVVLADTLNPSGGFTAADYQNFAARFDTLVFPLDSANFGAPTDIDKNGKVGLFFTRAVNEATPAGSNSYIAGFFADRDLFPKVGTNRLQACSTSNEAEMFYILAPDPAGTVNGNVRPTTLINSFTTGTLAHEFQHLINAGRRLYVNSNARFPEVTWLNEGLSHEAEELLYYRAAGRQPRQNLTDANIRVESAANYQIWKDYASQNFQRYASYLRDPGNSSPLGVNDTSDDSLSTRGGIWSFLRYSADRVGPTDGQVWFRMVNSTTTGLGTLRLGFGNDPVGLLRDWTLANYLDDAGITADARFQQPSWNFRDIYTKTFTAKVFPLQVTGLAAGASVPVSVKRGSASYYRLAVPANGQATVSLSSGSAAPPAALQFFAIRTR